MVEGTRVELITETERSLEQTTRVNDEIAKLASSNVIRRTTPKRASWYQAFCKGEKRWISSGYLKSLKIMFSIRNLRWKPLTRH